MGPVERLRRAAPPSSPSSTGAISDEALRHVREGGLPTVIAKKPTLIERQTAFLVTLNTLLDETVQIIDQSAPVVQAALVNASAALVIGADLPALSQTTLSPTLPSNVVPLARYTTGTACDDCGWSEGHNPEVEH